MENIKAKATNYVPESISFSEGYLCGLMKPDLGYIMKADWNKAKVIIRKLISDGRNIERVEMGLDGDWRENSMTVWKDGKFMMYDCFNGSKWAEPIIIVYYKDAPSEVYSVWRKEEY
jgi:hypothetical protein